MEWKDQVQQFQSEEDQKRVEVDTGLQTAKDFITNIGRPALLDIREVIAEGGKRVAVVSPTKVEIPEGNASSYVQSCLQLGMSQDTFMVAAEVVGTTQQVRIWAITTDQPDAPADAIQVGGEGQSESQATAAEPKGELLGDVSEVTAENIQSTFSKWYTSKPRVYLTETTVA